MVEQFIKLIARPWFSRVWTLQEFGVPQKIFFRCGTSMCTWYSLYFLNAEFMTHFQDIRRFVGSVDEYCDDFMRGYAAFGGMMQLRAKCLKLEPLSLQELLRMTSPRRASLPHDKIYGLLGFWQHTDLTSLNLQPNYDLEVAVVYTKYTTAFVQLSNDIRNSWTSPALDVLYDASGFTEKMPALPSWVPNWSSIIIRKPLGGVTTNVSASKIAIYYDASGWQSWTSETQVKPIPLVPIHPDPEIPTEHYPKVVDKTLKFRGVICDEIDKLLRIPPVRSIRVDLVPLFEGMRMLETSMAKNPYPTNEDMTTVAWKALFTFRRKRR
jgi:hypothetical protein